MKKLYLIGLALTALLFFAACEDTPAPVQSDAEASAIQDNPADSELERGFRRGHGEIVVANRASGSISVIDTRTDQLRGTFPLPDGDNPPEPMYVVFIPGTHRVFVGDRANDRVVVFRSDDYSVEGTVPTGAGVFHMWADLRGRQLWVNNDIDNTTTVIDPRRLTVLATVPTPADLVADGGKPHDVILGPWGHLAYVSVVGAGGSDWVVQYSTRRWGAILISP